MDPAKTLILTALDMEAKAIRNVLGNGLNAGSTQLKVVGICAKRIPELHGFSQIIVAGVAGALDPALKIGDLIFDPDGQQRPVPGARLGKIHTADRLISTPAEKAALFQQTGAAAVDMETSTIRERARPLGIPVLALRGISDTAVEPLSPELLKWVDDVGNPKPVAITKGIITHPRMIPSLIRLGRQTSFAMDRVAQALKEWLATEPR